MREQSRDAAFGDYVAGQRVRLVRAARLLTAGDDAAAEDLVQTTLTLALTFETDANGSPKAGPTIDYDGRAFFDNESAGGPAAQVGYEVSPGRWLVLQEAPALHWTARQMIEYLDGVVVTSAAVPMG